MVKRYLQAMMAVSFFTIMLSSTVDAAEKRCGWLENPTPGNWWLTDADGTWVIASQGGESIDDDSWNKMPEFNEREFVATNGSYGHGCACLSVSVDTEKQRILKVYSGKTLPLKKCLEDKALPSVE